QTSEVFDVSRLDKCCGCVVAALRRKGIGSDVLCSKNRSLQNHLEAIPTIGRSNNVISTAKKRKTTMSLPNESLRKNYAYIVIINRHRAGFIQPCLTNRNNFATVVLIPVQFSHKTRVNLLPA